MFSNCFLSKFRIFTFGSYLVYVLMKCTMTMPCGHVSITSHYFIYRIWKKSSLCLVRQTVCCPNLDFAYFHVRIILWYDLCRKAHIFVYFRLFWTYKTLYVQDNAVRACRYYVKLLKVQFLFQTRHILCMSPQNVFCLNSHLARFHT